MTVRVSADTSKWLELPQSFPTAHGESAEQWEHRVIEGMRVAWRGAMRAEAEEAARAALRLGLSRVQPEDSITLQFWPSASVVNAIVHVVAAAATPDDLADPVPLTDGPYATRPIVEPFLSDTLGAGLEARYLRVFEPSGIVLGGLAYFFPGATGFVYVGLEDTLPRLVGAMLEPLREIVRSIRWVDDQNGAWQSVGVSPSRFTTHSETWSFEEASDRVPG